MRTGKETHKIVVRETGTVTPSPDGKLLLCRPAPQHPQEDSVLWETAAGKQLHVLEQVCESGGWAFSPDGKLLATASRDGSVVLWDVTKGVKVGRIPDQKEAWPSSLAFSPDGKTLALGTDSGNVSLWDTASGKRIRQLVGRGYPIGGVAFAPDGRTLAAVDDTASIRLWNAATGKVLHTWKGHYYAIQALAFSFRWQILATSAETIRLWETATCKEVRGINGHTGFVGSLAFSPDGRLLASGSEDTSVLIWDIRAVLRNGHACGRTRSRRRNLRACGPTWQAGTRAGPTRRSERWLRCRNRGCLCWRNIFGRNRRSTAGHRGPSRGP